MSYVFPLAAIVAGAIVWRYRQYKLLLGVLVIVISPVARAYANGRIPLVFLLGLTLIYLVLASGYVRADGQAKMYGGMARRFDSQERESE